jgi:hypothetical protein
VKTGGNAGDRRDFPGAGDTRIIEATSTLLSCVKSQDILYSFVLRIRGFHPVFDRRVTKAFDLAGIINTVG